MSRRLFLFAAYDPQGLVDASLLWYLRNLKAAGDVVLFADCELDALEIDKLKDLVLHSEGYHHGEYDFGSYKRCFQWAEKNLDINSYDYIYMVNDSVFGPSEPLCPMLEKMESFGRPAFSLVYNPHKKNPHLQSWFIGLDKSVFLSGWFSDFLSAVTVQQDKNAICDIYENGFTRLLTEHSIPYDGLFHISGKKIYNSVDEVFAKGLPFIKKSAFTRHNGSLGKQIKNIMDRLDPQLRLAIAENCDRLEGEGYTDRLMTSSSLKIIFRYFSYLLHKIL